MSGIRTARNDDIEVLRAVSIIMVLYEHFGQIHYGTTLQALRMLYTGWTGVDLFFCISGFVIYRSLAETLHHGSTIADAARQIVAFWIRRFWRLAPTAWLWLLIGVLASLAGGGAGGISVYKDLTAATASLLNFENIHRYVCATRDIPCGDTFMHYWSLSLEVQFYLLLPFVILLVPRRWLAAAMAALIVGQFALQRPPFADSLAWYVRTDALAWGILIALAAGSGLLANVLRPRFLANPAARAGFTLGLLGLLGTAKMFDAEGFFTGIAAMLAAALVWAAACDSGYIWRPAWANALLCWIGQRSYSLYASHLIVFHIVRQTLPALPQGEATWAQAGLHAGLSIGLTVLAAALTYRTIERPLRRRGRGAAERYLAIVTITR